MYNPGHPTFQTCWIVLKQDPGNVMPYVLRNVLRFSKPNFNTKFNCFGGAYTALRPHYILIRKPNLEAKSGEAKANWKPNLVKAMTSHQKSM